MRPLPNDKTHGVIHTVKVKKDQIDDLAKHLNIPDNVKKRLRDGDEVHIVREADESELNRNKK
jgi:predicted RNA-binding protein with RPS1 domain